MPCENQRDPSGQCLGMGSLRGLVTVAAEEFADWGCDTSTSQPPVARKDSPFASEHEYRLCKVIVEHPLQGSSAYAKLAGMSPKTAQVARGRLLTAGFIRERVVNYARRGPPTLLLEPLPDGEAAVRNHESHSGSAPCAS
jgi:hypothetical protein